MADIGRPERCVRFEADADDLQLPGKPGVECRDVVKLLGLQIEVEALRVLDVKAAESLPVRVGIVLPSVPGLDPQPLLTGVRKRNDPVMMTLLFVNDFRT